MQSLNETVEKFAQSTKGAAASMSSELGSGLQEVGQRANEAAQGQQELQKDLEKTAEGSAGLRAALGMQSAASKELKEATDETKSSFVSLAEQGSMLAIAMSAVKESKEALVSVFNLAKNGATGLFSIFQGGIGIVTGFFDSLFGAAASYYNKSSGEWFAANQAIIESFGDLRSNEGAFVKEMATDLRDAQNDLAGAGKSLYSTIGNGAAILKEATALAQGFGNSLTSLKDQIKGAADEMFLMSKGMAMSSESLKQIAKNAKMTGGSFEDSMQSMMVASAHLSKKFGVSVKVIGKNLDQMTKDFETFGHLGEKELAAVATYSAKLGVEIQALKGIMDKFDSFEGAAEAAGKLNEAFGMNIDTMKMMNEENPAARMDMLRQSLADTGRSFEELSRHERKLMAQTMGMDMGSLQAAMSIDPDEMGFDDVMSAAEEAAENMSPEEAMMEVAKSIKELQHSLRQLADGPLANFIDGFTYAIEMSPQFRELLGITSSFLVEFRTMGTEVGKLFLEKFQKPLEVVLQYFRDLFSVERIRAFRKSVTDAFSSFFEAFEKADASMADAGYNLMEKLWKSIESWLSSGPNSKALGTMLKDYLIKGIKALGGMMSFVIEKAAEYIRDLSEQLKDLFSGDKTVQNNLTMGIGGALVESISLIYDTFKDQLWPALKELFWTLFDEYKWDLAKIVGVIIGFVIVKAMVTAMITAAASSILQDGISGFGSSIGKLIGKLGFGFATGSAEEETTKGLSETGNQLQSVTESISEIPTTSILGATVNAWAYVGLLAAALAMVAAVGVLAYKFQEAGLTPTMVLTVTGSLIGVAIAARILMEATKDIGVGEVLAAGGVLAAVAGLMYVGSDHVAPALVEMDRQMKGISFTSVLANLASTALVVLGTMGLALAAFKLKEAVGGYLALLGVGALLTAVLGFFHLIVEAEFGKTIVNFQKQFRGFKPLKFVGQMAGFAIGMAAAAVGMAALAVMGVAAIAAYGAVNAAFWVGAFSDKKDAGIFYGIRKIGEGLAWSMEWVTLESATKIIAGMAIFGLILYGLKKMFDTFGTFASLAGLATLGAIGGVAYAISSYFGEEAPKKGNEEQNIIKSLQDVIDGIGKMDDVDVKVFRRKISVLKEVIGVIMQIGEFAMSSSEIAAKIINSGAVNADEKDKGIAGMLTLMSGFIGQIAEGMVTAVEKITTLAADLKTKMGGVPMPKDFVGPVQPGTGPLGEQIKIIVSVAQATVQLGTAMFAPFQKVLDNETMFDKLRGKGGEKMQKMAEGVKTTLGAIAEHLPGILTGLFDAIPKGMSTDEIYGKALAMEATFNGILAVSQAMQILWELQKQEGIFEKEGAEKLKEVMGVVGSIFEEKSPLKTMFNNFYDQFFGSKPIKFTVNSKLEGLVHDTLVNIKRSYIHLREKVYKGMVEKGVVDQMLAINNAWDEMYNGGFMPSQVLAKVMLDAEMIADVVKSEFVDLSPEMAKIDHYTEFYKSIPRLFDSYYAAMEGSALPADLIMKIGDEALALANAMNDIEADLGEVSLNPVTKALLGAGETKEFVVRPDAMNLTIKLNVQMEAAKIAQAIVESTPNEKGSFVQTPEMESLLGGIGQSTGIPYK